MELTVHYKLLVHCLCCCLYFLSDPSLIILATLVSNSLTDSVAFSRLDWCDPGVWGWQLKLAEVVTVADVNADDRVGNSLLEFAGRVIKIFWSIELNDLWPKKI